MGERAYFVDDISGSEDLWIASRVSGTEKYHDHVKKEVNTIDYRNCILHEEDCI